MDIPLNSATHSAIMFGADVARFLKKNGIARDAFIQYQLEEHNAPEMIAELPQEHIFEAGQTIMTVFDTVIRTSEAIECLFIVPYRTQLMPIDMGQFVNQIRAMFNDDDDESEDTEDE